MTIPLQNLELGSINPQITNTFNLNDDLDLENAANRVGNILNGLGGQLENTAEIDLGKQQALADAGSELSKGAAGHYSHVSNFTPYGKAYNQVIDQIAPAVLSSNIGTQLQQLQQAIKLDNTPVGQKVQEFAEKSKEIISNASSGIDPEWRDEVVSLLYKQAAQEQSSLVSYIGSIQTQQQIFEAYKSLNQLNVMAQDAAGSGNLELSKDYINQINNVLESAIGSGLYTATQARSLLHSSIMQNFEQAARTKGMGAVNQINASLNDGFKLTGTELDQLKEAADNQFLEQQKDIRLQQLKAGYDFQSDMAQAYNNQISAPRMALDAQQMITFNEAATAGRLRQSLLNMAPQEQAQAVQKKDFSSLPEAWQNKLAADVARVNRQIDEDPINALSLQDAAGDKRAAVLESRGFNINQIANKIASAQEIIQMTRAYQADPAGTINNIAQKYGAWAPAVVNKIAKANNEYGLMSMTDQNMVRNYLLGKSLPGDDVRLNVDKLNDDAKTTLAALPLNTQIFIKDYIGKVGKAAPYIKANDLLNSIFNFNDGSFTYNADAAITTNEGKAQLAKMVGTENALANIDKSRIVFDPMSNVYNIIPADSTQPIYSISRNNTSQIQAQTMLDKIKSMAKVPPIEPAAGKENDK